MAISNNTPAPDFQLKDENGVVHSLRDFRGRKIVLYFYPKDDTPGCTSEACGFRDNYSEYENAGAIILGVSPDAEKSHKKFKNKYELPFALLADTDHKVSEAYGVWGQKKFMGKEYEGVFRTTFIIDEVGIISKVFEGVKPDGHSIDVLTFLQK